VRHSFQEAFYPRSDLITLATQKLQFLLSLLSVLGLLEKFLPGPNQLPFQTLAGLLVLLEQIQGAVEFLFQFLKIVARFARHGKTVRLRPAPG